MPWRAARAEITSRPDAIQDVADRIIASLEAGVKPWVRPWDSDKCAGPQGPFNPVTGHHYRGVNVLILGMDSRAFMTTDPRWLTYQQAKEKGYQVRKGEKATSIFFTKTYEVEDAKAEGGKKTPWFLKSYAVYYEASTRPRR
jgi:antirestriction protein ArdC